MKTAAGLERIKCPDCSEQPMAYESTKVVSSKADKHQGQTSLTVLDLGYILETALIYQFGKYWEIS